MEIIYQQLLITNITKNQTDKADVDTAQIKTICPPLILKCALLEEPSISVAYGFRSIKSNPSKTRLKTSIIAEGISWLLPKVFLGLVHKLLLQILGFFWPPSLWLKALLNETSQIYLVTSTSYEPPSPIVVKVVCEWPLTWAQKGMEKLFVPPFNPILVEFD